MRSLNGRLAKVEAAIAPPAPALWFQNRDPLVLFSIFLEKQGIELTNAEFTQLTGLAVPVELANEEIESRLIAQAQGLEWPDDPQTLVEHFAAYWQWMGVKRDIAHLVNYLASGEDKRRFSEWADGAGLGTKLTKQEGAYPEFWIAARIIEHYGNEFVQSWLGRITDDHQ